MVLVVILALLYSIFTSDNPDASNQPISTVTYSSGDPNNPTVVPNEAARLVRILKNLENIELDGSIFDDPAFLVLIDFSKIIAPIDKFRQNPFAPIGVGNTRRVVTPAPSQNSIGDQESVDNGNPEGIGDDVEFIGS